MSDTVAEAGASTLTRRRLFAGGAGLAVASGALWTMAEPAGATGGLQAADLAAIYQLKVNYAVGTDLIASGDVDAGRALYRITFTANAAVSGGFDRNNPDFLAYGPDELAQSVAQQTATALATQHLLGTVNIVPTGHKSANLTVYVQATVLAEQGQGLTRVLATYYYTAERRPKGWRLTSSFSQFVSVEVAERLAVVDQQRPRPRRRARRRTSPPRSAGSQISHS